MCKCSMNCLGFTIQIIIFYIHNIFNIVSIKKKKTVFTDNWHLLLVSISWLCWTKFELKFKKGIKQKFHKINEIRGRCRQIRPIMVVKKLRTF